MAERRPAAPTYERAARSGSHVVGSTTASAPMRSTVSLTSGAPSKALRSRWTWSAGTVAHVSYRGERCGGSVGEHTARREGRTFLQNQEERAGADELGVEDGGHELAALAAERRLGDVFVPARRATSARDGRKRGGLQQGNTYSIASAQHSCHARAASRSAVRAGKGGGDAHEAMRPSVMLMVLPGCGSASGCLLKYSWHWMRTLPV